MSERDEASTLLDLQMRLGAAEAEVARLRAELSLTMSAATYGFICLNQLNNPSVKDREAFDDAIKKMSDLLDQVLSMRKQAMKEEDA